ncbi:PadR family transcriptional regulator [Micromonospora zamorensis]|uniref:PadR family transcriptional regulator n=1 Tax=Micromonospora zamorensis TaxID=709883 RepID=UPI00352B16A8|nr:PadR family transcriptional regulator [Micromonospora zamorensis]
MASSRLRLTKPTLAVLETLADASPDDPPWGLRICELADLGSGTVYPILERLSELGWIESWQETDQPSGRPRRRYYRFTDLGMRSMVQAVAERRARRTRPASVAERAEHFLSQVADGKAQ